MSAREIEMAEVKAAERQAGGNAYDGSRARQSHIDHSTNMHWAQDVEDAVKDLVNATSDRLVLIVSTVSLMSTVLRCYAHDASELRHIYRILGFIRCVRFVS